MNKLNTHKLTQQFILCISITFLVFCISLNSGSFYSDDFPLYLAVIGLSGLYLIPKFALVQIILIDILLGIAYVVNPQKADPLSQTEDRDKRQHIVDDDHKRERKRDDQADKLRYTVGQDKEHGNEQLDRKRTSDA